jgi:hypothetical protein
MKPCPCAEKSPSSCMYHPWTPGQARNKTLTRAELLSPLLNFAFPGQCMERRRTNSGGAPDRRPAAAHSEGGIGASIRDWTSDQHALRLNFGDAILL